MSEQRIRDLIGDYLRRLPGADTAHRSDAQFHLEVHLMSRVLHLTNMAMHDEGVDSTTIERVIYTVIHGAFPRPEEAERRQRDHEAMVRIMKQATPAPSRRWWATT